MAERPHSFTMYTDDDAIIDGVNEQTEQRDISESKLLREAIRKELQREEYE